MERKNNYSLKKKKCYIFDYFKTRYFRLNIRRRYNSRKFYEKFKQLTRKNCKILIYKHNKVLEKDLYPKEYFQESEENGKKVKVIRPKYLKGIELGKGAYGQCYVFESLEDGKKFAAKIVNKEKLIKQKSKDQLTKEIKIQQLCDYSKIVKVNNYFEDIKSVYIIQEYCTNNTLLHLLKKRKTLTEYEVQCYMFQLIQGLKYLHSRRIIHRDLKPSNLFLDKKMELKIGDFGLIAIVSKDNDRRKTFCGTPGYIAPEIYENNEKGYLFEVDIWSMGVIMYQLLTGELPFNGSDVFEIKNNVLSITYNQNHPKLSNEAKDLIGQIFVKDQKKRPGLIQILYHDFFHKNIFPEFLKISYLKKAEDIKIVKNTQFIKNERTHELYKLIVNDIPEIQYKDIDKYSLKDEKIDKKELQYLTYFHKSHQGFYYYKTNNELVGINFEKEEKDKNNKKYLPCFLLDQNNNMIYYIESYVNEEPNKDTIIKFDREKCPKNLEEKLTIFNNYHEEISLKRKLKKPSNSQQSENSIVSQPSYDNSNKIELNIKILYIRNIFKEKLAYFIYLSDSTRQFIFDDKIQIIVSDKDELVGFIDKENILTIISFQNIFNNPNNNLVKRLRYIRRVQLKDIKNKVIEKINQG